MKVIPAWVHFFYLFNYIPSPFRLLLMLWYIQTLSLLVLDVLEQPGPHLINCNVNSILRDPFCDIGVSPNFCAWKANAIYRHPTFCNRFVQCVDGKVFVTRCQSTRTVFNSYFETCDFSGFLKCNNIGKDFFLLKLFLCEYDVSNYFFIKT